jgi:predicted RNase H-like HicB family nuclease
MKYLKKLSTFKEAKAVSSEEIFNSYIEEGDSKEEAAEKLLDIMTTGMWAMWDEDRIIKAKEEIIQKYSKEN